MSRERAKELLPIIQAYADGEDVQILYRDGSTWQDTNTPTWSHDKIYRIKPKPREFWMANTGDDFVRVVSANDGGWISEPEKWIKVREIIE